MSQESAPAHPPSTLSWEDSLATFLLREEGLEALRVDPRQRKISLATLGPVDLEAIQERLEGLLATLDEPGWTPSPVSSAKPAPAGFGLRVSHPKVDEMLLEKPSCDTAPKLWPWREFIWPEADELENQSRAEWVALAWQAGICGVALATGWTLS
ncbi:MAG: cation-transporting P-type ATPase, partial [Verrucomicrobiales bacterium]